MTHSRTDESSKRPGPEKRGARRRAVHLPARLTWKDQRGAIRFASVIARNVSELGAYVECHSPLSIPVFRLVLLQFERHAATSECLPDSLKQGARVLSAVYRVSPASPTAPQGLALRLMVDPRRVATDAVLKQATAGRAWRAQGRRQGSRQRSRDWSPRCAMTRHASQLAFFLQ